MKQQALTIIMLIFVVSLYGCTQHHSLIKPNNPSDKLYGTIGEKGDKHLKNKAMPFFAVDLDCSQEDSHYNSIHYTSDVRIDNASVMLPSNNVILNNAITLSPGDMIEVSIENGDGFNGNYVLDNHGFINIPYIKPIKAKGLSVKKLAEDIELALVRERIFRPSNQLVHVSVLNWSAIDVSVAGAVFETGTFTINKQRPQQLLDQRVDAAGDYSSTRMLSEALRSASGIRPDAKMDQIILIRDGWQAEIDMSGIFTGHQVNDVALVAGDKVIVPSTGCFQKHLVKPTKITPKGIRVFMSNLIDSAQNNTSAAIGKFSTGMPYGSRLLHAAVSANCVGGKQWTNASRKIVLASKNPITNQTQVIERSVEKLMRQAHLDKMNPYIQPNDAIACYDSDITNVRDIAKTIKEILLPF